MPEWSWPEALHARCWEMRGLGRSKSSPSTLSCLAAYGRDLVAHWCWLAGTRGPFTLIRDKSRLRLSSSGGGLFDGRPKTQTWVWGAFVFPPNETNGVRLVSSSVSVPPAVSWRSRPSIGPAGGRCYLRKAPIILPRGALDIRPVSLCMCKSQSLYTPRRCGRYPGGRIWVCD